MTITVFKGFDTDFLKGVDYSPLLDNPIKEKKNPFLLDKSYRKKLDIALLSLQEGAQVWITYEEYSLIKSRIDDAISEDGLKLIILRNNLFPDYYPLSFEIDSNTVSEIISTLNGENTHSESSAECRQYVAIYNSLVDAEGVLFGGYYNYEYDCSDGIETRDYYPQGHPLEESDEPSGYDVQNVYHYAVSGNLSDYVQEIGRAARKVSLEGKASMDFFSNDMRYMKTLFGMSQIKQYQIKKVLEGIYETFKRKKEVRSFLITPESFTYIFNEKDEKACINKLKTCLLMLEKDFYDKYNFKVLISRPQSVFTKAFICIDRDHETEVLKSEYGVYMKLIAKGRFQERQLDGSIINDYGDICL